MTTRPDIAYDMLTEECRDSCYHFEEFKIASNPASPLYAVPEFVDTDRAILDVGCGLGQTFVASPRVHGRLLVGLDINLKCLNCGHRQFGFVAFANATAERLPFRAGTFDLVMSRVSLPYTNVQQSLSEAVRVLKPNGRVWFTLHPFSMQMKHLLRSIRTFQAKDVVFRSYVLVNGLVSHLFGRQFPFIYHHRYQSFQTVAGMFRDMKRVGLEDIFVGRRDGHLLCTGSKR